MSSSEVFIRVGERIARLVSQNGDSGRESNLPRLSARRFTATSPGKSRCRGKAGGGVDLTHNRHPPISLGKNQETRLTIVPPKISLRLAS